MNSAAIQPTLVEAALDLLPPGIRRVLLNDSSFLERWGISTVTDLTLGKSGPSFLRSRFYDGMRSAIRNHGSAVTVQDQSNIVWSVVAQPQGETLEFSISAGGTHYSLLSHSALAESMEVRTNWFERTAKEINFEVSAYHSWLARLCAAPLSDDEFAELIADIKQTPVSLCRTLQASMEQGSNVDLATLVPHEPRYYERLVGHLGSAATVTEYIEAGAKPLIAGLQRWNDTQGFLYALLTCSVEQIAKCVQINNFESEELIQAYQWLVEHGDPISRIGAVEIALSHLDTYPELAPLIERIVEDFLADEPQSDSSDFELLSTMIVVVASELARKRTLANVPPFYRRQAAIAQASLIIRAINAVNIDPAGFIQWARSSGMGHIFLLQGLVDLRCEPRWLPYFISADQLRAEFVGRIANAASRNETKIQVESLRVLLLGPDSKLASAAHWPLPSLPGPLEGEITPRLLIPEDILKEVRLALEANRLEANSFVGLINSALLFDLPEGQSSLAAAALRRVKFSVDNAEDEDKSFALIHGLAIVAAVTRGIDLADALRVLTRVLRRRKRFTIDPDNEMHIAIITAASFESLGEWARFTGEWITEIAFEIADKGSARKLLSMLRRLLQIEPALARYCAAADAALAAFAY